MSILPLFIKRVLLPVLALWLPVTFAQAQGRSIPRGDKAAPDSAATVSAQPLPEGQKYRYPLINRLEVAFDIASPVMELFNNYYGDYSLRATLNLHHRFMPQLVLGIGHCNEMSQDAYLRYKVGPSFFAKAGIGYNFKFNDVRPYDFYWAFARYGFSSFKADILDIVYNDGYWDTFISNGIENIRYNCHWLELGGGIHVQIAGKWGLGWEVWYKVFLAKGTNPYGSPYYVPGYGTTTSHIGFSFNVSYDIF